VLALAKPAHHANRLAVGVGSDHRVHAIGLARAAEVFDRFAGTISTRCHLVDGIKLAADR
jgi:hypothetical protein